MTRTITTADLAPLVTRHGADFETSKWTVELGFPASEPVSIHSWQADLLAAIPSAPAPVVSDAAVEALSEWDVDESDVAAIRGAALEGAAWALIDRTSDTADREPSAETIRDALRDVSAAFPLLGAAPSATREEVARVLVGLGGASPDHSADAASRAAHVADALLARFTITPRTDR